jgi:hypothetical protein
MAAAAARRPRWGRRAAAAGRAAAARKGPADAGAALRCAQQALQGAYGEVARALRSNVARTRRNDADLSARGQRLACGRSALRRRVLFFAMRRLRIFLRSGQTSLHHCPISYISRWPAVAPRHLVAR